MDIKTLEELWKAGNAIAQVVSDFEWSKKCDFGTRDYMFYALDKKVKFNIVSMFSSPEKVTRYIEQNECSVQEYFDDEMVEAVIVCEGDLWETLWYQQDVCNKRISKKSIKALLMDMEKAEKELGFYMDLSNPGCIKLNEWKV